jgi:hypothetical protein
MGSGAFGLVTVGVAAFGLLISPLLHDKAKNPHVEDENRRPVQLQIKDERRASGAADVHTYMGTYTFTASASTK